MTFSDSDWTRDPPLRPRTPPLQRRTLLLAIAIAVSCVAIAMVVYSIEQLLDASTRDASLRPVSDVAAAAPPGAGVAATPMPSAASNSTPSVAPPAMAAAASAATASAIPPPALSAEEINARQLVALEAEMRQRARETAEQHAIEAARRKERAWQRFYQRPDFCADNPTAAQMVQCANHHIRARKEFEDRYAAGKL